MRGKKEWKMTVILGGLFWCLNSFSYYYFLKLKKSLSFTFIVELLSERSSKKNKMTQNYNYFY